MMGNSSISFEQKICRFININVFFLKNQCKADGNPEILFCLSTFTKETLNKNLTFSKTNVINANKYFFLTKKTKQIQTRKQYKLLLSILCVTDEGFSRNAPCAVNLISTFSTKLNKNR